MPNPCGGRKCSNITDSGRPAGWRSGGALSEGPQEVRAEEFLLFLSNSTSPGRVSGRRATCVIPAYWHSQTARKHGTFLQQSHPSLL